MKFLFILLATIVTGYLAMAVVMFTQQRKLIYFPTTTYLSPADVRVEAIDEIPVQHNNLWYLAGRNRVLSELADLQK